MTIGLLGVAALLITVLSGIHIAVALIVVSVVTLGLLTGSFDLSLQFLSSAVVAGSSQYVLAVIPLFVLMGAAISRSRIADQLFALMHHLFRRVRGGIAVSTVLANTAFSAVTGISLASATIFSQIAVPQMVRLGYNRRLALGSVAGSSVLGMLIPPSVLLILYGVIAQESIGRLFLAGIIPGLILAALFVATIVLTGFISPARVGLLREDVGARRVGRGDIARTGSTSPDAPLTYVAGKRELPVLLAGVVPIAALAVVTLGGIWYGVFTPTEGSAVGAVGALLLAPFYGMSRDTFPLAWRDTAVTTGSIMLLLIGATLFSRMLALSGVTAKIGSVITNVGVTRLTLVLVTVAVLLVLGTILDSASILIITIPFFLPGIDALGLDGVWFGIVAVIAVEMGLLTPPFGGLAFAVNATLGDEAKVEDVFMGALPFLAAMAGMIGLLIAFPQLAVWLPSIVIG